mmetsp:Transcript_18062/g.43374  ORF Transcript_18062/g.43374 Transcript_18062/m.43374 type:complete len:229 (-) Transcript_18062:139-825(-)
MATQDQKELIKSARQGNFNGGEGFDADKSVKHFVAEILRKGLDGGLDFSDKPLFRSALFEAAWRGHRDICKLLLDKQANVNFMDTQGRSPLHEACYYGHLDLVELFIERQADINLKDTEGSTPLVRAVDGKRSAIVSLLVDRGARTNEVDADGVTCQHVAAFHGDPELSQWLFYQGAWKNRFATEAADTGAAEPKEAEKKEEAAPAAEKKEEAPAAAPAEEVPPETPA